MSDVERTGRTIFKVVSLFLFPANYNYGIAVNVGVADIARTSLTYHHLFDPLVDRKGLDSARHLHCQ